MAAGLGMMASKNRTALGSIGEGGMAGLNNYTTGLNALNQQRVALDGLGDKYTLAQAQAKQGNFKTAAELAHNSDTFNSDVYGKQIADRRVSVQDANNIRSQNTQQIWHDQQMDRYDATDATRNRQIDAQSNDKQDATAYRSDTAANKLAQDSYQRPKAAALAALDKDPMFKLLPPDQQAAAKTKAELSAWAALTPDQKQRLNPMRAAAEAAGGGRPQSAGKSYTLNSSGQVTLN